jgi:hypothetical protein
MNPLPHKQNAWPAIALRFILPGVIALLFLVAPGHGASNLPPVVDQPPGPEKKLGKQGLGWGPAGSQCPLPPASAFPWQTNLRKYLETWPTPGSTSTEAWPEYVPEDGEDLG